MSVFINIGGKKSFSSRSASDISNSNRASSRMAAISLKETLPPQKITFFPHMVPTCILLSLELVVIINQNSLLRNALKKERTFEYRGASAYEARRVGFKNYRTCRGNSSTPKIY